MKEVDIVSKIVNREGGTFVPSSKGTQSIDLSDYLLKSIWDKVFEVRTDSQGIEYIFGKLPMVTQYGITMYSGDGVDIPSLASGLPFDGRTIWYNPDTQQIEVIGGTGGGSGEGVSNFWDLSGIPSWITNSKPTYSYSEITGAISTTELQNYLTQNSYLNVTSGDNRYLKLSGGTLTSSSVPLYIDRTDSNSFTLIGYRNTSKDLGYLGFSNYGDLVVSPNRQNGNTNYYAIWHSGNDGHNSGLDADMLDGYHVTHFMSYIKVSGYVQASLLNSELWNVAGGDGYIEYYDNGTWFNSRWGKVLAHYGFDGDLRGNASSATKLQTARTIWGRSFDGTGNVSGDISDLSTIAFDTSGGASNIGYLWTNTRGMHMDMSGLGTEQQGTNLTLTPFGNVGIGTANPAYKLHVEGNSYIQGVSYVANYISFDYKDHSINNEGAGRLGTFDRRGGMVLQFGTNTSYRRFSIIDQQWTVELFYVDDSGNVFANGGITMYSDQRKKTILNHVELSLKDIANAPLIEHYYNSDDKKTTHVGSIAQYWASMNDWFCKLDSEGYYTMEIQNAALASAISIARELDRYETKTDKAIKKLKKRICELEEEVERLKAS